MSGKQSKKLRQLYRKDLGKQANEQAKLINAKIEEYKATLETILKPPPKWIPEFIWVAMQKVFLNV